MHHEHLAQRRQKVLDRPVNVTGFQQRTNGHSLLSRSLATPMASNCLVKQPVTRVSRRRTPCFDFPSQTGSPRGRSVRSCRAAIMEGTRDAPAVLFVVMSVTHRAVMWRAIGLAFGAT